MTWYAPISTRTFDKPSSLIKRISWLTSSPESKIEISWFSTGTWIEPDTLAMYEGNTLRVVPELVYSPYATAEHLAATGKQAKPWRIDLVLFVNGMLFV